MQVFRLPRMLLLGLVIGTSACVVGSGSPLGPGGPDDPDDGVDAAPGDPDRPDASTQPGSDAFPSTGPSVSGGSGGASTGGGYEVRTASNGVPYGLHTPPGYSPSNAAPLLLGVSGTEGRNNFTQVYSLIYPERADSFIVVVVGGPDVGQTATSGAKLKVVLDEVRASYNVDLKRQYLNTVSYGTVAGLQLVMNIEQDQFAAAWFTAPIANMAPSASAQQMGFAPAVGVAYGTSSGDVGDAGAIATSALAKGYDPVIDHPRAGGHSPGVPGSEWEAMWQLFASHSKP